VETQAEVIIFRYSEYSFPRYLLEIREYSLSSMELLLSLQLTGTSLLTMCIIL
jgi:hypothetical protein